MAGHHSLYRCQHRRRCYQLHFILCAGRLRAYTPAPLSFKWLRIALGWITDGDFLIEDQWLIGFNAYGRVPMPFLPFLSLVAALEYLNRVQKRRAVVFIISDFLGSTSHKALAVTRSRHDLVAISVSDPREHSLPDVGFVRLQDAETGETVELDTHSPHVRQLFDGLAREHHEKLASQLRRAGIDQLPVSTREPYTISLRRFFEMRERRNR